MISYLEFVFLRLQGYIDCAGVTGYQIDYIQFCYSESSNHANVKVWKSRTTQAILYYL